ncbi:hypothetical protein JoomaDRAFT_3518 [Galbibacter orientalis DSM 19592]|uniref:Uncharacterized protein n=1 Tax=Galbibacter orientalis DSM 19592 TaxID=926559 RepID=I3CA15_9FLAO|nr:hypothetical protein JoomaDRAFT_3518 [Galbibacter orientalis DSM 19592]
MINVQVKHKTASLDEQRTKNEEQRLNINYHKISSLKK